MRRQSKLLGEARSTADYKPAAEYPEDIRVKRLLDEIYLMDPYLGSRCLVTVLERDHGTKVNRKRLDRLRRERAMGWEALGWATSSTMGCDLCLEALEMARLLRPARFPGSSTPTKVASSPQRNEPNIC